MLELTKMTYKKYKVFSDYMSRKQETDLSVFFFFLKYVILYWHNEFIQSEAFNHFLKCINVFLYSFINVFLA